MIVYCGLNCSGCDAYIATKANDNNKRIEVELKGINSCQQ